MNILIITFTKGVNPGTIMQALGVKKAVEKCFADAKIEFLNFPDFKRGNLMIRGQSDSFLSTFKQKAYAAYRLLKYNNIRRKNICYSSRIDLFNYSNVDLLNIKTKYDLVLIGSDTILEEVYSINGKIGLNWLPLDIKKVYFAASASPANFEIKTNLKSVVESASFIGLRDTLSINLFKDIIGVDEKRIVKQPDPSYYLDVNKFELSTFYKSKLKTNCKYVLYNFNSNFPYRKLLADMLRDKGYKVISTAFNPYADICFATLGPEDWAGVFREMDLIVTERFHDSLFGLRNCRPVIALDWDVNRYSKEGNSKTLGVMEDYDMANYHFNVTAVQDLSNIVESIDDCVNNFDVDKVARLNNQYISLANKILDDLKLKI